MTSVISVLCIIMMVTAYVRPLYNVHLIDFNINVAFYPFYHLIARVLHDFCMIYAYPRNVMSMVSLLVQKVCVTETCAVCFNYFLQTLRFFTFYLGSCNNYVIIFSSIFIYFIIICSHHLVPISINLKRGYLHVIILFHRLQICLL